ncbi:hypothetical protein H0H93_007274, partial [Arthromyces matolae]
MAHFVVEKQLFTKIQGDRSRTFPATIPPKIVHDPERRINLRSVLEINWASDKFPFLMAVPIQSPFYAPLFDRLDYRYNHFPISPLDNDGGGSFKLRPKTIEEWKDLELNLRAIVYAMSEICLIHLPKDFRFWAPPTRYGYADPYTSMEDAQLVAFHARNSFIPFIAAATFYLALMNTHFTHPPVGYTWRQAVLNRTGVHHQWLSELEHSVAGDLNIERVGAIVNPKQFPSLLPSLSVINMPIFICWGPVSLSHEVACDAPEYLKSKRLVPTVEQIKMIQTSGATSFSQESLPTPSFQLRQQQRGEDWKDFFLRRQKANEVRMQSESSVDRQARESRAQNALNHAVPEAGSRVFGWKQVNGFHIRKPVGRKHVENIWGYYGNQQRHYDAFRDEWDLCSDFGSDGSDSGRDVRYEELGPQSVSSDSLTEFLLPAEAILLPVGPQSSIADLQRDHGGVDSTLEIAVKRYPFSDTAEDRACYRYGFIVPSSDSRSISSPPPAVDSKKTNWSSCLEYLGNGRWLADQLDPLIAPPAFKPSTNIQQSICTFFEKLLASQKIDDIPDVLYDLQDTENQLLQDNPAIDLRSETIEGIKHFFIRPHEPGGVLWEVKLTSAATVLEILRRQWGSSNFFELVHELLDRGISFQTCIKGPAKPPPPPPQFQVSGLGYRPKDYKPDELDYLAYVFHRDNFLRTPRGRAALLKGGIISRLARDVIEYQHVLDGPTCNVFSTGTMLPSHSGVGYWDDTLNEHEIYLICGVYKVDTDQRLSTQTADFSWWPKPSAWDTGTTGINIGFWTEDCERWYQGQLKKIKKGEFILRNSQTWKNGLKFNRTASKVAGKNERLAGEYLART